MIRNPYAKKPSTASCGQKRVERPWDKNATASDAASGEGIKDSIVKSNDGHPPLPDAIVRAPLVTLETIQPTVFIREETIAPTKVFHASTLPPRPNSQSMRQFSQDHGKRPFVTTQPSALPRPESRTSKMVDLPQRPQPASPSTSVASTSNVADPRQRTLPRELQFSLDVTQPVDDEYRVDLVRHAALGEPLSNGWTLYSHQKRAILVSLLMRRHILALDMGLGKTLIGCCWARAFYRTIPNLHIIVLCPVSLKDEWLRTSKNVTSLPVRSEEANKTSQSKASSPDDNDAYCAGVVTIVSWAKIPSPNDVLSHPDQPFVVVADEAHSMQNMASARTRDALRLMLAPNAKGVLLLTGTPVRWLDPSDCQQLSSPFLNSYHFSHR
jgi:SNF2-related domain